MRWVRRLLQAALLLLLLAGVAAAGFRAAMHYAPEYRERLVAELETRLQADVEIGRLNLAWEGFGPAVSMQEVRLQAADAAPLRADALRVGLDPLRLLRGQLQPRRITIDGAEVVVHHAQGRWQLRGLPRAEGDADPELFWRTLESLDSIRVRNAVLHLPAVPAGALAPAAAGDAAAARDTAAASGEAQPLILEHEELLANEQSVLKVPTRDGAWVEGVAKSVHLRRARAKPRAGERRLHRRV